MATKRHVEPIASGAITLRLLEERDLPTTLAWRNQDHIRKWFFNSALITPEQHRAWWEQYRAKDDDFVFVIEEREALGRPVGQASIYRVDGGRAEFGRTMIGDDEARGRGLAQLATSALVDWAFRDLGVREVHLEVMPANSAARAVYDRCGFTVESATPQLVRMIKRAGDGL